MMEDGGFWVGSEEILNHFTEFYNSNYKLFKSERNKKFQNSIQEQTVLLENVGHENEKILENNPKFNIKHDSMNTFNYSIDMSEHLDTENTSRFQNLLSSDTKLLVSRSIEKCKTIPNYNYWLTIKKNYLVEDEHQLNNFPYMGDDIIENESEFFEELIKTYDPSVNSLKSKQASILKLSVVNSLFKNFIKEFEHFQWTKFEVNDGGNCSEEKCLVFLKPPFNIFNKSFVETIEETICKFLLEKGLTKPTDIWLCDQEFSLKCKTIVNYGNINRDELLHSYRSLFCRICYRYDCLTHGVNDLNIHGFNPKPKYEKYKNTSNSEPCSLRCYKTVSFNENILWSDSTCCTFIVFYYIFSNNICALASIIKKDCCEVQKYILDNEESMKKISILKSNDSSNIKKKRKKKMFNTKVAAYVSKQKQLHSFTPCSHDGESCMRDCCSCFQQKRFCEKFCQCSYNCSNRFAGCKCRNKCKSKHCPCFTLNRECDPDICYSCGASDFHKWDFKDGLMCQNVSIQRSLKKRVFIAPSLISGWGLFAKEAIYKNEFIEEYLGELITQDEADRRGKIYDKTACSFLFNLNHEYVVDATRKGNKMRFANHSINPNCIAKVVFVNGDHRIGIYAKNDINPEEELLFDYRFIV